MTMLDLNEDGVSFIEDIFTLSADQLAEKYEGLTHGNALSMKMVFNQKLEEETVTRIQSVTRGLMKHKK